MRPHPLVERTAVNRVVVGSSPTRGVGQQKSGLLKSPVNMSVYRFFCFSNVKNKITQNGGRFTVGRSGF